MDAGDDVDHDIIYSGLAESIFPFVFSERSSLLFLQYHCNLKLDLWKLGEPQEG